MGDRSKELKDKLEKAKKEKSQIRKEKFLATEEFNTLIKK